MKLIIFLLCVGMVLAVPPLVPSQIDGHVLDAGEPVIGATIKAYIDINGDGDVDSGDELIAETTSLDLSEDAHDGYFRIMVTPGDYSVGETDLVLVAEDGTKTGTLSVKDIVEGTSFDNDVAIEEVVVKKSSGGGGSSSKDVVIIRAEDIEPEEPEETPDDDQSSSEEPEEPQEEQQESDDDQGSSDDEPSEDTGATDVFQEEPVPELSAFQKIQGAVLGGGVASWMSAILILAIISGLLIFAWMRRKE